MSDKKSVRLNKLAKEFNVGMDRILAFLIEKGVEEIKPSSKISHDLYMDLLGKFQPDLKAKLAADVAKQKIKEEDQNASQKLEEKTQNDISVSEKSNIESKKKSLNKEVDIDQSESKKDISLIKAKATILSGPKITGQKIDLEKLAPKKKNPVAKSSSDAVSQKK
ncbi:MAG: hypothetical protein ACKVJA_03845, partial [Flavobacteriales bacterium]